MKIRNNGQPGLRRVTPGSDWDNSKDLSEVFHSIAQRGRRFV